MENTIYRSNLINKLNKLKDKYPNIITLWEKMLKKKEEDLKKTYEQCEEMLKNVDNLENDLHMNTIITLYLLKIYST